MAITVVNVASAQNDPGGAAGSRDLTISVPTDTADGDVMYAFLATDDATLITSHASWTDLINSQYTTGDDISYLVQRRVASSEPASYLWNCTSANSLTGGIITLRGVDATTQEDVALGTTHTANDPTPDSPSVTTVTDGARVLVAEWVARVVTTLVEPTGSTQHIEVLRVNDARNFDLASFEQVTAGATGAQNWPNTGGDGGAGGVAHTLG